MSGASWRDSAIQDKIGGHLWRVVAELFFKQIPNLLTGLFKIFSNKKLWNGIKFNG